MEGNNAELNTFNLGLEIGGTSIKAALVLKSLNFEEIMSNIISKKIPIKTFITGKDPNAIIDEIKNWVNEYQNEGNNNSNNKVNFICMSMFGPLNLNKNSEDNGQLVNTPKPGWKDFNVVKYK